MPIPVGAFDAHWDAIGAGVLAEALLATAAMIIGPQEQACALSLSRESSPDELHALLAHRILVLDPVAGTGADSQHTDPLIRVLAPVPGVSASMRSPARTTRLALADTPLHFTWPA